MDEQFEFRGLQFRALGPIGIEVKVKGEWCSTDFVNRKALNKLGPEIPDIAIWDGKAYLGSIRFTAQAGPHIVSIQPKPAVQALIDELWC